MREEILNTALENLNKTIDVNGRWRLNGHLDEIMIHHKIPYCLIGVSAIALELLKKGSTQNLS